MDQNKNQGGQRKQRQGNQQSQGAQGQGSQQPGQHNWNQSQNPDRDPAEGQRQQTPGRDQSGHSGQQFSPGQGGTRGDQDRAGNPASTTPERARGSQGERNSSSSGGGISNRGMDREEEQEDLPFRGEERGPRDQSER
jgi:hypothetical protein